MKINHIYNADCVEILEKKINDKSINLIYADPPYNLSGKKLNLKGNKTGGDFKKMNEDWDIFTHDEYLRFSENWIKLAKLKLVNGGSLYISCTYHNIGEIIGVAKKNKLELKNIITWYKTNSMPSITKRTFTHSSEYVCWFTKGKNWKFNYDSIKNINPRKTKSGESKQMRDFFDFIELPIVQGKERLKNTESNSALHPTQKPEKLMEIILTASSDIGDIVLDPFFGTGTFGLVAKKLGRNYIGIEINKKYYKSSIERIKNFNEKLLFV